MNAIDVLIWLGIGLVALFVANAAYTIFLRWRLSRRLYREMEKDIQSMAKEFDKEFDKKQ